MVEADPTSHGTNVCMSSSVPFHVVIGSIKTGSVPWHGECSSHEFWKVHIGSRKEHDHTTKTDTIFRIHVSIFRIPVSILRSKFPIRPVYDVIFCLGEFLRQWSWIMSILLWCKVVSHHDECESGFLLCDKYLVIPLTWRIRATSSHICKGYKSDEDEIQIQFQFQF